MSQTNGINQVIDLLCSKASVKQEVFEVARQKISHWKAICNHLVDEVNPSVVQADNRVQVEFIERNEFEGQLKAGSDTILLNLHTNIFAFPKEHHIWQTSYVRENPSRAYFAVFHLYNFLSDSIKYNRLDDQGVLLCRVFVNCEGHFFVEGKKQLSVFYKDLENDVLEEKAMRHILETVLITAINYDLTVPDFQEMLAITIRDVNASELETRLKTTKPIGYLQE